MKALLSLCLCWPALVLASEAGHGTPAEKPPAKTESHAIKNAPPTKVDNLKGQLQVSGSHGSEAPKASTKPAAAETKAEAKTETKAEPAKPAAHGEAPKPQFTEPPVVQYVPPKYGSSSATPVQRVYVPSKSPAARKSSAHAGSAHGGSSKKSSGHGAAESSQAVTPGLVRVMPASSLPGGKVLPPAKGLNEVSASSGSSSAGSSGKPRLTWGETTVIKPAASPAPEIYIVRDPELRWQQYSYP
ncbi:hypothetical protein [Chitinibacter sp. ZOR0017]|uniref:hypothetical protein n=1 Tax=Chitinibacter sp. ZOR0017 TaxID=1339254 RepID=UPI000648B8AD|nr:hypothetical protein [Chitinibacter sp. ZOR0017]